MCDLGHKIAIVTGSTRGIGLAIARALTQSGAHVMLNSINSVELGNQLAQELPNCAYTQADISQESHCLNLVEKTLAKWGKIDILINNAGISERVAHNNLAANTDALFERMWQTNLMSAWYLSRASMPHLEKSAPGHIINISSIAGSRAVGSSIPYGVSKAALDQLTKLLAHSFGAKVRVNAIAPGFLVTERTQHWDEARAYFTEHNATESVGLPDDVAKLALGILSSEYMNGQIINCDGGFCL